MRRPRKRWPRNIRAGSRGESTWSAPTSLPSGVRWPIGMPSRRRRRQPGTHYGDAATVGAGLPALSTLRRLTRAGDTLIALTGVFSGSLSFLFNAFDGRRLLSSLLEEARARGYTEPDPRADLSGRDVARKLLIVARAAGSPLEERDIEVEDLVPAPLRDLTLEGFLGRLGELDVLLERRRCAAAASGKVLRYVA